MSNPAHTEAPRKPGSMNAIIQRINRRLAQEGEQLRRARQWTTDTGDYYVVDVNRSTIERAHVDVDDLARELGVLRPGEFMD